MIKAYRVYDYTDDYDLLDDDDYNKDITILGGCNYKNFTIYKDFIDDDGDIFNLDQLANLYSGATLNKIIIDNLEKKTGQKWYLTTIRGYSQSDWAILFYSDNITLKDIDFIESWYFSLYSAWSIDDIIYIVYDCNGLINKAIRENLADQLGTTANNIVLYDIVGHKPIYEKTKD